MTRQEGSVMVKGTLAYAPQSPWYGAAYSMGIPKLNLYRIMSATVRENILFSHEYDEYFYNLVIEGKRFSAWTPYDPDICPQLAHLALIFCYFRMVI